MSLKPNYQNKKLFFFLTADILLISGAMMIAFLLRFDGIIPKEYYAYLPSYITLSLIVTLPILFGMGLYAFTWAFISLHEIIVLFKSILFSTLLFIAIFLLFKETLLFARFPRSILILNFVLVFILLGFLRAAKRIAFLIFQQNINSKTSKNTLIIGADEPADQLIRTLLRIKNEYKIKGILDNMSSKRNTYLHGIPILGTVHTLPEHAQLHRIETIIIALHKTKGEEVRAVLKIAHSLEIKDIKIIPSITEILSGTINIQQLRPIKVEDLLGRNPTTINTTEIERFIHGKKILITGAAGSIGSELCRQISKFFPHSIHLLDHEESNLFDLKQHLQNEYPNLSYHAIIADIKNSQKINRIFEMIRPEVVFHAAAYKHVPLMEDFPEEAIATNVFGTFSVANAAMHVGTEKFVLISSDKAVHPTSVMGKTKRIAEMIVQAYNHSENTHFVAVRFGNVLGSRGSVVPIFENQIKQGGPITITDPEMTRFFMTIPEAVLLVMEAGAIGKGGEIFVLDMGERVKIIDLAREMIHLSGLEPEKDIPIVFTGIRPGEKITEELLTAEEGTTATQYQKIFRVKSNYIPVEDMLFVLKKLEMAFNFSNIDIHQELETIFNNHHLSFNKDQCYIIPKEK